MIRHAKDLIGWMNWEEKAPSKTVQKHLFLSLSEEEEQVLSYLEAATTLDELSLKCQKPIAVLASLLLQLELKGVVRSTGGKKFERC